MEIKHTLLKDRSIPEIEGLTFIFGAIVGSHAYGTNVEGSDVDLKWVYVQSAKDFYENGYKEQINISKDETAFELKRFLDLCRKANPTMLELIFSPEDCIVYEHISWRRIKVLRRQFLTKECYHPFVGYAISQIEKAKGLEKKMNWEKEKTERKGVLDFCYFILEELYPDKGDHFQSGPIQEFFASNQIARMGLSAIPHTRGLYNLFYDVRYKFKGVVQDEENSNDISASDVPKDANCVGMMFFNKDAYQTHCKHYKEYRDWLDNRNTQRYVDIEGHGQMIDGKNLLHCVRLIETGLDIARFQDLWVRRHNTAFLIGIRKGIYDLDKIVSYCEKKLAELKEEFKNSSLKDKFNSELIVKSCQRSVREQVAALASIEVKQKYY